MALLSKKEFSERCGITTRELAVYKNRGKVVLTESELIDDTNPVNLLFMEKQAQLAAKRALKKGSEPVAAADQPTPLPRKEKKESKPKQSKEHQEIVTATKKRMTLDSRKKEVEIEKLEQEASILNRKREQMAGRLVPTDLIKGLFHQHYKSFTMNFKQAIDIIATEFTKRGRLNRNEKAELNRIMVDTLNRSVEDSISLTKRDIENLVMEYTQVRTSSR